jgi:enoyl-CoA hydratase/carnithine racemase
VIGDDGVLEVRLTWPEVRNALGPDEADELTERLTEAEDERCRAVVLSAEGRAFCAGGNLRAVAELARQGEEMVRQRIYRSYQGLVRRIRSLPVPVLAAVDGPAIGLGFDLALACDLRFFGRDGWVQQGWASVGLIPAVGGFHLVRSIAGRQAAWELMTERDRRRTPQELERLGLGRAVDDAGAAARTAAADLATLPRDVLAASKELLAVEDFEKYLERGREIQAAFFVGERFSTYVESVFGPR